MLIQSNNIAPPIFILKNCCHKSRINFSPFLQKGSFLGPCRGQNVFGKTMGQKNIFGGIFGRSAEISAAQPQMKFQKLEKRRVKIEKICIFLLKWD